MNRTSTFTVAALAVTATITLAGCHTQHPAQQATTHTPPAGSAQDELASIPTRTEVNAPGYKHEPFARHGKCDTRALLLQKTGKGVRSNKNCTVVAGTWTDSYSGATVNSPKKVDIDHMIPLAEAWRSGAATWSPQTWGAFVNDLDDGETVVATASGPSGNRAKGDKTPDQWLPANASHEFQCDYTKRYVHTQHDWNQRTQGEGGLSMDASEKAGISRFLDSCSKGDVR